MRGIPLALALIGTFALACSSQPAPAPTSDPRLALQVPTRPPTPTFPLTVPANRPPTTPTAAPAPTSAPALSEADIVSRARAWLAHISRGTAIGSGVVVSSDGHILTNDHVVRGGGSIRAALPDGRLVSAEILSQDPASDLALLKAPASGLEAAKFADTSRVRLGEPLLVIGFALDLPGEPTVTRGVFSGRRTDTARGIDYIQTDASMNPGMSGGPVLNPAGDVVGISAWGIIRTPSGQPVQGVNFAIPAELAMAFVDAGKSQSPTAPAPLPPPVAAAPTRLPTAPAQATAAPTLGSVLEANRVKVASLGFTSGQEAVAQYGQGLNLIAIKGSCGPSCQQVFFFVNDRYLGTDTLKTSTSIGEVAPVGPGRIRVTYTPVRPPVTITYTWNGQSLTPDGTPPGH